MEWHVCMHVNKYSHTHCHAHSYDMYINITYLQICMHVCICTADLSVRLVVHQPHVCLNTSHKNIVTSTWFTNFKILIIFWLTSCSLCGWVFSATHEYTCCCQTVDGQQGLCTRQRFTFWPNHEIDHSEQTNISSIMQHILRPIT